jgi:hypothetical protein
VDDVEIQKLDALVPPRMTGGAYHFFRDTYKILDLQSHFRETAEFLDDFGRTTGRMFLSSDELSEAQRKTWQFMVKNGFRAVERSKKHDSFHTQMIFARFVDSFLTFVSDLIALIYRTKPEALRSREQVRLEEVLRHPTMEALVESFVERKVHELSYQGMANLSTTLEKELGFSLFAQPEDLKRAVLLIEQRNLIAHARGVVNEIFLQRVPNSIYREGETIKMDAITLTQDLLFLAKAIAELDVRAVAKFGIGPSREKPTPKQRNGEKRSTE